VDKLHSPAVVVENGQAVTAVHGGVANGRRMVRSKDFISVAGESMPQGLKTLLNKSSQVHQAYLSG
jgi:hypothetical protein